ncbi:hypothetical protein P4531_05670 [Geobacillus stearothermophilus]|nr:hypothetical protein [Geobacillus stearothermophilus]MED3771759.1 hypothetical protein [Geobacillus stearothermophilus]
MGLHYFLNHKKEDLYKNVQEVYKSDDRPWVVGFSGGKDVYIQPHHKVS